MKAVALMLCAALAASAAATKTWEMNGYDDFVKGRINGLTLTAEGRLALAPALDTLHSFDQPEVWSIARGPDGSIYAGTGDRGRLYRIDPQGRATLLWTAAEPEIFAVAVDSRGIVYAGTSPNGKVYRIENGQATEYFAPPEHYIWSLAIAQNGDLFAGTGDQGKVYRVTGAGRGEVYYETGQAHVTALAFDPERRLLAGTEPNGILYRITAANRAFVLYDANLPEIRSMAPGPDGSIYAVALGGGVSRLATAAYNAATAAQQATVVAPRTSITVSQQGGLVQPATPQVSSTITSTTPLAAPTAAATSTDYMAERSALYKIHADNTVETLWTSNQENAYDLAVQGNSVLLLTDLDGRIYRVTGAGKPALIAQTGEGDATRLLTTPSGTLAATGRVGKLLRLGTETADRGTFESPVHDANAVARWGRLSWRGSDRGVAFRTRTGNTIRPDATWSDWSDPITNPDRSQVSSPNARYIQWRAELTNRDAAIDNVTVAYRPQNGAPTVRSITVSAQTAASFGASTGASSTGEAVYSISVSASGDVATAAGTPSQTVSRPANARLQVSWQADDPDGDRLLYGLYFRGDGEQQWKLLRNDLGGNTHTLDADLLADGRYTFRVTASDKPANPPDEAREAELLSAPVLVDNTPPLVEIRDERRNGARLEARVEAEDRGSVLRRAEYSIDAGPWTPFESADGVTDSERERFALRIDNIPAGEHLVTVRVYDAAGNAGLAKFVTR